MRGRQEGLVILKGSETRAASRARARTGSSATFELLRSKLSPPAGRPGLVERRRIVDRFAHGRGRRFVSVVAPPGYGKTTAIGQWAARDPRTFAWVSLDQRDNDPVVLLSYVAEALNADGSIARSVFKALAASGDSIWASSLPRLGAALASPREPFVLVLDDVHVLQDHGCLDALAALALHVPAGSQLVFSGRSEPQVGLAKLRVDRELLELGAPELALNDAEARALLTEAGVELTATETAELNRHAEGWAAGLYLAALSLSRGSSSAASFDGSDRFVTDYLRGEELSDATPDETDFLLCSAVLETMSGPLCDAVLQRSDSAAMLERLALENLFVIPLDNTRSSFRYHHLFREMLLAELERSRPDGVTELRARAAAWCEANGRLEDAIEYATAGGDTDTFARLVTANAFPYYRSGRVSTVERWLSAFDEPELLARHPAIAVLGAWLHALRGRPDAAERWALALEASEQRSAMPDGSPFEAWAATVRALLCRGGVEQMKKDAELAVRELTPASHWRPASLLLRAVAALLLGDEQAETKLAEAADAATAGGAVWAGVVARSELALLALERGDLIAAEAEAALASEFLDDSLSVDYVVTAILHAVTARLAIAQGRGARARQALAAAQRLRPMMTHAFSWFSVQVRLELASAHLALRDPRGAATLHQETEAILRRRPRLGGLAARAEQLRTEIGLTAEESSGWASTLTAAELRLLPLLTSHLTFREIAERLFVSRNTVKTQAISIYRKLDASSRGEAVERAVALGLVDAGPGSQTADFTRSG